MCSTSATDFSICSSVKPSKPSSGFNCVAEAAGAIVAIARKKIDARKTIFSTCVNSEMAIKKECNLMLSKLDK